MQVSMCIAVQRRTGPEAGGEHADHCCGVVWCGVEDELGFGDDVELELLWSEWPPLYGGTQ